MKKRYLLLIPLPIVAAIIVCIGSIFGILTLIFGTLKANPAYQIGMEMARHDPAVVELFGSPINDGFFVGGTINNPSYCCSFANLETSISGPKAQGAFAIHGAEDQSGAWTVRDMSIRIGGKLVLTYSDSQVALGFHKP